MKTEDNRVVVLIDMDCFYVQVEERENPQNKGKPACVVQYKNWKGGGIIAVNYEARAKGISRQMRGDEAKEKCPECILYRVPELRGKADLTKYCMSYLTTMKYVHLLIHILGIGMLVKKCWMSCVNLEYA